MRRELGCIYNYLLVVAVIIAQGLTRKGMGWRKATFMERKLCRHSRR